VSRPAQSSTHRTVKTATNNQAKERPAEKQKKFSTDLSRKKRQLAKEISKFINKNERKKTKDSQ